MTQLQNVEMTNLELSKLIKKTPLKLMAFIANSELYVPIEKQYFLSILNDYPQETQWEVTVTHAIFVDRIPY